MEVPFSVGALLCGTAALCRAAGSILKRGGEGIVRQGEGNVCLKLQEASSSQGISTGTGNCVGSIRYSVIIQIFFFTALLE